MRILMKKIFTILVLMLSINTAVAEESIWNHVKPEVAQSIFEYMKDRMNAPEVLPMPDIRYASTTRSEVMMQYYNVGKTYGSNMPWIHYYKNVKRENKEMIIFFLAHEFAHYLLHAKQNDYLYPRAGNQYWEQVTFNHHCNQEFIRLLDDVADYMKQNNWTSRVREMKENTRYNCKIAGNE